MKTPWREPSFKLRRKKVLSLLGFPSSTKLFTARFCLLCACRDSSTAHLASMETPSKKRQLGMWLLLVLPTCARSSSVREGFYSRLTICIKSMGHSETLLILGVLSAPSCLTG